MPRMPATAALATALATTVALTALAPAGAQQAPRQEADLVRADGTPAGTALFVQTPEGLLIRARLENLPPGIHGFHIHETGACAPDFAAAGGHYDPAGAGHGYRNPEGFHAGDLPNLFVREDGTTSTDVFATWLTLGGSGKDAPPYPLADGDGAALVVHAVGDDYRAAPPGSTGARIACGVIAPPDT